MVIRVEAAFVGGRGRLRNGWWIAIFLAILTLMLVPALLLAQRAHRDITIAEQGLLLLAATWLCQLLRRRPLSEVVGRADSRWLAQLVLGLLLGAALMLVPALVLTISGSVTWEGGVAGVRLLGSGVLLMAAVAVAEELLFRGVLFQRLVDGLGLWPAQILIGGLFALTHLDNPGMTGAVRLWAGANIFAASILFGLAYARTRSLALPIGIHFMANVTQGVILGFGVSGTSAPALFAPRLAGSPVWWTGGAFGLEASLPGLVSVIGLTVVLLVWRPVSGSLWGARPTGPADDV